MNALDALRTAARAHPGGVEALAIRLGKSVHTLRHELAGADGHKLGLLDALAIADFCGTTRLADVAAAEAGGMYVPLVAAGSEVPMQAVADAMRELAELAQSMAVAWGDGHITPTEMREIDKQAGDVIAVVHTITGAARAACEAGVAQAQAAPGAREARAPRSVVELPVRAGRGSERVVR